MQGCGRHIAIMVGICTVLHFLVDALCLCCLYLMASAHPLSSLVGVFVTYNVLAFLTQPLTGWLADSIKNPHWMLLSSILLLVVAVSFSIFICVIMGERPPKSVLFVVAVLLGVGNSIFHTWGGKQTVLKAGNDPRALGVFVSTGALGLSVGALWCSWPLLLSMLALASLLAVVYLHSDINANIPDVVTTSTFSISWGLAAGCMVALIAFVMFRSYMGQAFTSGMEKGGLVVLVIGFTSMLGKMSGGWLVHHFGVVRSFAVVLVAFLACFFFGGGRMALVFLGLFLVNCTMPITLYLANMVLPGREGLAFGLLAAALIPGFLMAFS